nr:hypothetical protein [Providencia alcalifaciens]
MPTLTGEVKMAERSFVQEVQKLRQGEGEVFSGEGILAVTKALLESGVSYVAGYQGAPISHLMDVLADAQDILSEYGIRFENSASEATAAATLAASVNYPLRGAVTFKATVGTNVASDALANLASGGVLGGRWSLWVRITAKALQLCKSVATPLRWNPKCGYLTHVLTCLPLYRQSKMVLISPKLVIRQLCCKCVFVLAMFMDNLPVQITNIRNSR